MFFFKFALNIPAYLNYDLTNDRSSIIIQLIQ